MLKASKFILFILTIFIIFILQSCAKSGLTNVSSQPQKSAPDPRAIQLFIDGVDYEAEHNYPAALLLFHEAAIYDSTSPAIQLKIGKNYFRLGKEESAMYALRRSLRYDPDQIEPRELLAQIYANQGWWDLSARANQSIVMLDSTNENAYYRLALLYLRLQQPENAMLAYEKLLTLQPQPDPKVLIGLSELYLDMKRFDDAAHTFEALITFKPNDGFGYFGMGMCSEARQDTALAIDFYQKAWQLSPDLEDARDRLVRLLVQQEDWSKAILFFKGELERDSTDLEQWLALTDLYEESGDSLNALIVHQRTLGLFPNSARAHMAYGRYLLRQGNYDEAFPVFQTVTVLDTAGGFGWLFAGISLAHLERLDEAKTNLDKALKILPEDPLGNYYLGMIDIQQEKFEAAIFPLKVALQVRPDWLTAISALATAYESVKMYDQADSLFRKSLDIAPDNALILNNYAYSLSLRGVRLDDALAMATRALAMEADNGAYYDTVGWIYFKLGQAETALEYIRKAASLREDSAEVFDHLGDVYEALQMETEAKAAWAKALELDQDNPGIQRKLITKNYE